MNETGQEDLAEFLAQHRVEIVASLPCYEQKNVDNQRGKGVYNSSISALQTLNKLGYGKKSTGLELNLMYNPSGESLPPSQQILEYDYKKELKKHFNIVFNHLYTLTNMPIMRFGSTLISKGRFDIYMQVLKDAHQEINLKTIMCRTLISVDWRGYVFDCDFNQLLNLPLKIKHKSPVHICDLNIKELEGNPIVTAEHCYGCTAGNGSSCGGALG